MQAMKKFDQYSYVQWQFGQIRKNRNQTAHHHISYMSSLDTIITLELGYITLNSKKIHVIGCPFWFINEIPLHLLSQLRKNTCF